jgi:tRNA pseudouridine32 synthase/23S rRNA pseudouridine746 synthase
MTLVPAIPTPLPPAPPVILHRDAHVLVADKPAGLLSVPGKAAEHADCLEVRLRDRDPALRLVHRLDMDTSGVMVFALTHKAQRHLGLQFERRHVTKTYIAEVAGVVDGEAGEIDLPLAADWPRRPLQKVCLETGRPALTRWQVAARRPGRTRLLLFPRTGRSHQLRVHLAAIGHPILGDRFYGDAGAAHRMLLHASRLEFHHPDGGARVAFDSPCPF